MNEKLPIVILISGNGSNLQAIINATQQYDYPVTIKAVISNKANAYGLQRAQQAKIPTVILNHTDFANRNHYDQALLKLIERYQPKLVILAGFMRILSADFVTHFAGRLLNIHPSLLPKYKGLNTHQRVLKADDKVHGCTVHFVSNELDSGKTIAQKQCEVENNDTIDSLRAKVHQLEYQLYPEVIRQFALEHLKIKGNGDD